MVTERIARIAPLPHAHAVALMVWIGVALGAFIGTAAVLR